MQNLEIINCILTILSVFFLSKEKKVGWLLSAIVCLTIAYIYKENQLWFQFSIQFLFFAQSIVAYFKWNDKIVTKLQNVDICSVVIGYLALSIVSLYWIDGKLVSYIDLLLMFISLVANHLLMFKNNNSWYLWLLFDIISIMLCLYLELYITTVLFFVLGIICIKTILTQSKLEYEKI